MSENPVPAMQNKSRILSKSLKISLHCHNVYKHKFDRYQSDFT